MGSTMFAARTLVRTAARAGGATTAAASAGRTAVPAAAAATRCVAGRFFSTPAAQLAALVDAVPKMETMAFNDVGEGLKWSFEDLKKHSDAFAGGLLETGWGPGDALAVWLPKESPETVSFCGVVVVRW